MLFRSLKAQAKIAQTLGIEKENIFILSSGDVLEMGGNRAGVVGRVPVGSILVDGLGVGDVGNVVLRDRQHLAEDGIMVVVMSLDRVGGQLVAGPDIVSRGFVYVKAANYESINGDNNGNLLTVNEGEDWSYTYGLYSYDGKVIFKDGYEQLDYLKDNKYKLYDGTHYGVTALNGTAVIPMKYVDMRLHTMDFIELYDGKNYSIVDLSNQTIVPATTERIQLFHSIPGNPLSKDLGDAMWMAASYDGYKESELPFCYKLADGSYATVYADYNTGKVTGTLANRASLPNADGIFVYQATNGLFGFGNLNGDSQPDVPDQPTSPAQNAAANPTDRKSVV